MKSTDQATRCPGCKTVFRVVPDQLRVSEGWVRCGRCTNVFNAAENMMDMDDGWARWSESPAENAAQALVDDPQPLVLPEPEPEPEPQSHWRPPRGRAHRARQDGPVTERLATKIEAAMWRSQQPTADQSFRPAAADSSPPPTASWQRQADEDWAAPLPPHLPPAPPAAPQTPGAQPLLADSAPAEPSLQFDETRPESLWPQTSVMPGLEGLRAENTGRSMPGTAAVAATAKPGFMRQAENKQLWRRPQLRALLAGAVAGSALLLLAQVGLAYRDWLAARQPGLKPVLEALCASFGCKVQAARSIESMAVESSGLVRVDKTTLYKLQVTLRNRANLELALPALDVTFTDSRGDVISRKVLLPQDLSSTIDKPPGDHGGALAAGREVTLQGTLQTSSGTPETVAGYTVELFYP